MVQTLAQITKQIEKLQKEADALRHAELKGVVDRIKVAIAHYGLTPEQLGFGKPAVTSAKPAYPVAKTAAQTGSKTGSKTAAPRFADGEGQVWSGRGPRPRWLREALANGRSLGEFSTDAQKRPSSMRPTLEPHNGGAVVVPPAKANAVAKRANAPISKAELTAQSASLASEPAAEIPATSVAAPKGKRGVKPGAKSPHAKKTSAAKAVPVKAKSASQPKTKRVNRVAASSKATVGVRAEKSGAAAPASASATA